MLDRFFCGRLQILCEILRIFTTVRYASCYFLQIVVLSIIQRKHGFLTFGEYDSSYLFFAVLIYL